jgi:alpha-beta hydrolase superfamily lysophospholipase
VSTDPVLGAGYTLHRIDLGSDDEGPLQAGLVHREPAPGDAPRTARTPPILLLHGWSDYVFDRDLMDHLGARGHDVWGLDLRKYGRSLRPGQTPTEIDHLSRYDAEIGTALRRIGRDTPPVVLAHSTGGLTATLYALRHPGAVRGLALNSPWLEMHLGPGARALLEAPVRLLAERLGERPILPPGSDHYARATHRDLGGDYDYDLSLKPPGGHRFPARTLNAVLDGQRRLAAAGPLAAPVLVMHSARSLIGPRFDERMLHADTVLDVRSLAAAARRLGPRVRIVPIAGARHDVFLSEPAVRARALEVLDEWLRTDLLAAPTMTMTGRAEGPDAPAPGTSKEGGA